ncbi:MAG: hypothetical protein AAFV25_14190 [Bacteroidota bacterium]
MFFVLDPEEQEGLGEHIPQQEVCVKPSWGFPRQCFYLYAPRPIPQSKRLIQSMHRLGFYERIRISRLGFTLFVQLAYPTEFPMHAINELHRLYDAHFESINLSKHETKKDLQSLSGNHPEHHRAA